MKAELLVEFIRDYYQTNDFIPLHEPKFVGNEKKYVLRSIESTFVSSVGEFVNKFERKTEAYTKATKAVATVNGTAALHIALYMSKIQRNDLVITQALTFVASCNAIFYLGAEPVFVDVSPKSLGLCPKALESYLSMHAALSSRGCIHKKTGQKIKAVLPMHTFGHPVELDEIVTICAKWKLSLIEDAAESLGSFYANKHCGTFGNFGVLSFNGNKIITTGGGGMLLCKNSENGLKAKHITTTAKQSHPYEFFHDELGFNYRMPNINAALGCAQIEKLEDFLKQKRQLASKYAEIFNHSDFKFVIEPKYAKSNYWLNAVICPDRHTRNTILKKTNALNVMTRPVWKLMHRLPMFENAMRGDLAYSEYLEAHLINLPSSINKDESSNSN